MKKKNDTKDNYFLFLKQVAINGSDYALNHNDKAWVHEQGLFLTKTESDFWWLPSMSYFKNLFNQTFVNMLWV